MKTTKIYFGILIFVFFASAGCDSLRFAPSQEQKQNAWLHNRTMQVTAQTARQEGASEKLQELAGLGEIQSRAFVNYCGLPYEFPKAESAEEILSEANVQLANTASQEAAARPDGWQVADSAIDLGIGIFALLGGVSGTAAVRFLKNARTKSQALKEIIAGNELFKKQNASAKDAFKQAQADQSPETRQLVAQIKA
jgi:hypothetical protein